jgi:hypothetical protein
MDILANLKRILLLYRDNLLVLLIATALTFLLSVLSLGLLAGPLVGGLIVLCLKLWQEEETDYKEIFKHFDCFLPTLLITFCSGIIFFLVSIIGAIPLVGRLFTLAVGPALFLLTGLALAFVVEQKLDPLDAIKHSVGVCLTEPIMIWFYSLTIGILGSLGALLFIFPVILTAPITFLGTTLAYQQLSPRETATLTCGRKEKQIGLAVLAGFFLVGLIFRFALGYQPAFFGRTVFNRQRPSLSERVAGKVLSSVVGEEVKVGRDGSTFSVGGMTIGSKLPKGYPKDVPIYPRAEIQSYLGVGNGDNSSATFSSKEQPSTIAAYYERELTANGWEFETSSFGELLIIIGHKDHERTCSISITASEDKETTMILTLERKEEE